MMNRIARIMMVDDEEMVRKSVRMTLEKKGYEVIEAMDGQEAIELIHSGDNPLMVSVIITDIRMPKINGLEFIAYLRSQHPKKAVIVLTGFPDMKTATSLFKQGVIDYLVKPHQPEVLLQCVEKAVDSATALEA